ncbi:MAG TPA: hypothetical protein VLT92_06310 [Burkholderiales bacterium]|nr:hypothetical protein [Burkholderiales bacterium]
MSAFRDPFDPDVKLSAASCGCGRHARAERDADLAAQTNGSESNCPATASSNPP